MPDKTPMELAQRILARKEDDTCAQCEPDCMCSEREARRVAAAMVERLTPVEVDKGRINWPECCAVAVSGYPEDHMARILPKCCPNCGKPLVWK